MPYYDGTANWSICPFTGSLLKTSNSEYKHATIDIPLKVSRAIECCNQPYLLSLSNEAISPIGNQNLVEKIEKMHNVILKLGNSRFYIIRLYCSFRHDLFDTTAEAVTNINSLNLQIELKNELCLPKSFLAAKISKSFKDCGVIFIGPHLPTGNMHAWIIENGTQPDSDDRDWVNYRPLLAFYN